MSKKKLTLSIRENLIEIARNNNLNISTFLEKRLTEHFSAIQVITKNTDMLPSGFEPE